MDILLVEDDNEISEMLKSFLESEGYRIETTMDGEEAWHKFQCQNFSLILLDLMIPKINGMEIMKRIRKSSTIPIIIISAKDTDSDKTLGLGLERMIILQSPSPSPKWLPGSKPISGVPRCTPLEISRIVS